MSLLTRAAQFCALICITIIVLTTRSIASGSLAGSVTTTSTAVNLTTEGTADWEHWGDGGAVPGLTRKSVTPQLSAYTYVGTAYVNFYSGDPRLVSWTDGTPTGSSTNNSLGVFAPGTGNGFSFIAPADATTRTLKVYAGGSNSTGHLVAHLSDSSAADYVDSTPHGSSIYDGNYTLTYHAASAGQTLTVTWTLSAGTGNVDLNAADLAVSGVSPPPAPTGLTATPGNAQAALSWTASSGATSYNVLRSTVNGSGYASVATGITTTSYTNTGLTNGTTYFFVVTATNSGGTSGNSNQASATPSNGSGSLSGSVTTASTAVNLTTEGTADWEHWGDGGAVPGLNRKSVTAQLSAYTYVGTAYVTAYTNDPRSVSWTDGTPTGTSSNNALGVFAPGVGNGFSITAPADTTTRTFKLYGGGWNSTGHLVAHLSDSSASDYVDSSASSTGNYDANYTLTYHAASAGKTLTVTWTVGPGASGNIDLNAADLAAAGGGSAPPAPTGLTATGGNAQAALSWTASGGATSYNVYRGTAAGGESGTAIATGVTTTSYTNTGLTNGTAYFYKVAAVNANGTSGQSNEASATPSAGGTVSWVYYNGAISPNWPYDYSWGGMVITLNDTSGAPLSGPYDIKCSSPLYAGYQPASLGYSFDVTGLNYLNVALKPTVSGQTWATGFMYVGDISTGISLNVTSGAYGPANPVVGQWNYYKFPLSAYFPNGNVPQTVYKFSFADDTGGPNGTNNTWYIDNLGFSSN